MKCRDTIRGYTKGSDTLSRVTSFCDDIAEYLTGKVKLRNVARDIEGIPQHGHGTLAGEHPREFSKEVQAAQRQSLQKEKL